MEAAVTVALAGLVVVTLFQLALALGAPAGAAAWGGRHAGVLPTHLRIASAAVGLVVYPVVIAFVADAAGIVETGLADGRRAGLVMWFLAILFALGAIANLASRSMIERLWAPVALAISISLVVLATGM